MRTEKHGYRVISTKSNPVARGHRDRAILLPAAPAEAACTPPATSGPITPAPGTVVTCSGATIDQNAPNGYGTLNKTA